MKESKELSKNEIEKLEKEALQKSLIVGKINRFVNIEGKWPALLIPLCNPSFCRDDGESSRVARESARKCSVNLNFETPNRRFFWISYDYGSVNHYQDEKTKILLNQFFREADYSFINKLCQEGNYNPKCIRKFDKTIFDNLYRHIAFLLEVSEDNNKAEANIFCQISDILIITDYSVYIPIKDYLSSLFPMDDLRQIAGIIPVNLKNGFKLIMASKQGLLLNYDIFKVCHDINEWHLKNYCSYLHVDYKTQLLETNPAIAFKE